MLLTFSPFTFFQDGLQPLLLLFGRFGHAHKPLVLCGVVDFPAIADDVPVAVVVRCGIKEQKWTPSLAAFSDITKIFYNQTYLRRNRLRSVFNNRRCYKVASQKWTSLIQHWQEWEKKPKQRRKHLINSEFLLGNLGRSGELPRSACDVQSTWLAQSIDIKL